MRSKVAIALLMALVTCATVQANTSWTGGGGDGRWDNPLNWSSGLPQQGLGNTGRTIIGGTGTTVLIDAATAAECSRLLLSDDLGSEDVTINMTGGTLTANASTAGERSIHIGSVGKTTWNLSGGVINLTGDVRNGADNVATAQGIVNISGGTFNVSGSYLMGQQPNQILQQQINISGGALNAGRLVVDQNTPSTGGMPMSIINMTGGAITVNDLAVPNNWSRNGMYGAVQLDAGTITVNNASIADKATNATGFRLANGAGDGGQAGNVVTGKMDITNGILKLNGDATAIIANYVSNGYLTGFGSPANIVYDFNNTNPGFTTVKAMLGGTTDTTWTGSGDGTNWTSAGNWNAGVPTGLVAAHINGAANVQIGNAVNATAFKLSLAENAATDNTTLNVNGGTLNVGNANTVVLGAKGHGTLNLSNSATVSTGPIVLGADDGETSARGTLSVANSTLNATGPIRLGVGNASSLTQTLSVSGTSTVTATSLTVAEAVGSVGQVNVSGGTLTVGTTNLGRSGAGTMTLTGGTTTVNGNLVMGVDNAATNAKGTLTVNGGNLKVNGILLMGNSVGTTEVQTLNMMAGTLTANRLFVDDNTPTAGGPAAIVNMTGGVMSLGDLAIPTNWGLNGLNGHFDLHGGIVLVNNPSTGSTASNPQGFRIANGVDPVGGLNTVTGSMDITSGALLLAGDATTLIQDYINGGILTGSAGAILFDYNVTNPGYTTVHTAANNGSITTTWTGGGGDNNWQTSGNWNNGVPGVINIAQINGSPTVNVGAGVNAVASTILSANGAGADNVTINANGGTLTTGGNISLGAKGHATLNVSNSSVVNVGGSVVLGVDNGQANARGTVSVNGGTLAITGAIRLGAGDATAQTQQFTVAGTSTVTAGGGLLIGDTAGTVGQFVSNGGTTTITGATRIGNSGSGSMIVTGGDVILNGNTAVGANSTGSLTISGGTVHVQGAGSVGRLRIGGTSAAEPGQPDAAGTVTLSGGSLIVDERILLGAAKHATAVQTMNISGGTLTAAALFVSDEADDKGLVHMTGGNVTVGTLAIPTNYGEPNLVGKFNLWNGTVTVNSASAGPGDTATTPVGFRIANGNGGGANTVTGKMDLGRGTLKLNGDTSALIDSYIADESLVAFNGTGLIHYDFNTTNVGFTTVTAEAVGDANRDGVIDIFDVNTISDNWGVGPEGDVNADGAVDIFDVNVVSDNWGRTLSSAQAVPEPATLVTLVLGVGVLLAGYRRRSKTRVA